MNTFEIRLNGKHLLTSMLAFLLGVFLGYWRMLLWFAQ